MNHLERFHRVFRFMEVDRVPDYEFGYWVETIDRWHREGLPTDKKTNKDVELYLGLEGWDCIEMLPVRTGLWPTPPSRIIKEDGRKTIIDDGIGGIYVSSKIGSTPPYYIRYPIRSRNDWEKLRQFFDPNTPGRLPLNWDEIVESYRDRDYPLGIGSFSLYGWLRNWMGVKGISVAFYRDPDWVCEMMDTLVELWIALIRRVLKDIRVDFAAWWEDMCYNRGPLISPIVFEEFMVPRYKRVTDVLKEYGVTVNILDCDGEVSRLIPGWIRGGINCLLPLEARCNDLAKLSEEYHGRFVFMGGVDKMALIAGGKVIDSELEKLKPILEAGGYIPMVDHRCPPEVSYQTYLYYLKRKRELIGRVDL